MPSFGLLKVAHENAECLAPLGMKKNEMQGVFPLCARTVQPSLRYLSSKQKALWFGWAVRSSVVIARNSPRGRLLVSRPLSQRSAHSDEVAILSLARFAHNRAPVLCLLQLSCQGSACSSPEPNPSIEATHKKLRFLRSPHVKR